MAQHRDQHAHRTGHADQDREYRAAARGETPEIEPQQAVDWRRKFMTFFLALGQCGRNPEARREQRRHRRTYQRHQHCKAQTDRERDLRHRQPGYHARRDRQSGSGQCEPEGASQDTNA